MPEKSQQDALQGPTGKMLNKVPEYAGFVVPQMMQPCCAPTPPAKWPPASTTWLPASEKSGPNLSTHGDLMLHSKRCDTTLRYIWSKAAMVARASEFILAVLRSFVRNEIKFLRYMKAFVRCQAH
eukprot:scaffold592183_cov18-Prasinocladus_malaysianus.AAC.1